MGNQIKTTLLLTVLTLLIIAVGGAFGGKTGMIIAFLLAGGMNLFSYWFSDRMVLKMYKAREVNRSQAQDLYGMVEDLAKNAQIPMPKVYIIPQQTPNAFATGRNPQHAVVAVTEGLLELMDREEIKGVLAHELSHIKDRDILISTIAATLAGAIMVLAGMARWTAIFGGADDDEGGLGMIGLIVMSIIAPIAAVIVQMAISRSREYLADSEGAKVAGSSEGLAGALEKLGAYSQKAPMKANPATAHMFIVNPLSGGGLMKLFSTHPPLEERIARLRGRKPSTVETKGNEPGESRNRKRAEAEAFWDRLK